MSDRIKLLLAKIESGLKDRGHRLDPFTDDLMALREAEINGRPIPIRTINNEYLKPLGIKISDQAINKWYVSRLNRMRLVADGKPLPRPGRKPKTKTLKSTPTSLPVLAVAQSKSSATGRYTSSAVHHAQANEKSSLSLDDLVLQDHEILAIPDGINPTDVSAFKRQLILEPYQHKIQGWTSAGASFELIAKAFQKQLHILSFIPSDIETILLKVGK